MSSSRDASRERRERINNRAAACAAAWQPQACRESRGRTQPLHATWAAPGSSGVEATPPSSPPKPALGVQHRQRCRRRGATRGLQHDGVNSGTYAASALPLAARALPDVSGAVTRDSEGANCIEPSSSGINEDDDRLLLPASVAIDSRSALDSALQASPPKPGSARLRKGSATKAWRKNLELQPPSPRLPPAVPSSSSTAEGVEVSVADDTFMTSAPSPITSPGLTRHDMRNVSMTDSCAEGRQIVAGEEKILEMTKLLDQCDLMTSYVTVRMLATTITRGNRTATLAVCDRLEHPAWQVRKSAARALKAIARKGDVFAIDAVTDRLEHPNEDVRRAATNALASVADVGCIDAIATVAGKLTHDDPTVRHSATHALRVVAERGNAHAIDAISMRLNHADEGVRKAAKLALNAMSHNVATLAVLLEDEDARVRAEAVKQLRDCVPKGDPEAVAAVVAKFAHPSLGVRKSAVKALGQIAVKNDPGAIWTVGAMLEHEHEHARSIAAQAFKVITTKGDPGAMGVVATYLASNRAEARTAATQALAVITHPGDSDAINAVSSLLGHSNEDVRTTAAKCLATLAERGNIIAISAVEKWLLDDEPTVRRSAVKALGGLVEKGMAEDISLVTARMHDSDVHVRVAAVNAMKTITQPTAAMIRTSTGFKMKGQVRATLVLEGELDFRAFTPQLATPTRESPFVLPITSGQELKICMNIEKEEDEAAFINQTSDCDLIGTAV